MYNIGVIPLLQYGIDSFVIHVSVPISYSSTVHIFHDVYHHIAYILLLYITVHKSYLSVNIDDFCIHVSVVGSYISTVFVLFHEPFTKYCHHTTYIFQLYTTEE